MKEVWVVLMLHNWRISSGITSPWLLVVFDICEQESWHLNIHSVVITFTTEKGVLFKTLCTSVSVNTEGSGKSFMCLQDKDLPLSKTSIGKYFKAAVFWKHFHFIIYELLMRLQDKYVLAHCLHSPMRDMWFCGNH